MKELKEGDQGIQITYAWNNKQVVRTFSKSEAGEKEDKDS